MHISVSSMFQFILAGFQLASQIRSCVDEALERHVRLPSVGQRVEARQSFAQTHDVRLLLDINLQNYPLRVDTDELTLQFQLAITGFTSVLVL